VEEGENRVNNIEYTTNMKTINIQNIDAVCELVLKLRKQKKSPKTLLTRGVSPEILGKALDFLKSRKAAAESPAAKPPKLVATVAAESPAKPPKLVMDARAFVCAVAAEFPTVRAKQIYAVALERGYCVSLGYVQSYLAYSRSSSAKQRQRCAHVAAISFDARTKSQLAAELAQY
jgi:hypothetical protein